MNRTLVLHLVALVVSATIIWWLYRWTMLAFYPPLSQIEEYLAKPWRAWARLAFSATIAVLLLGTQALVARKARLL